MKKALSLTLALALLLALCACAPKKSAEAAKADELILAIGVVDADSADDISLAERYYDTLTPAQQAEVEHLDVLQNARNTLDLLTKEEEEPAGPEMVKVPDVAGIDLDDARNILSSSGLIPSVTNINSDSVAKGKVVRCQPAVGKEVEKNSKVTLFVSDGPSRVEATSSYCNWNYISNAADDWNFYNPYIEDGMLYIECYEVTFGASMQWRDRYDDGYASGTASINDVFDKTVPVKVHYEYRSWDPNETQSFLLEIPLADLDVDRPTDMYFRVGIRTGGQDTNLTFSFSMTWPKA